MFVVVHYNCFCSTLIVRARGRFRHSDDHQLSASAGKFFAYATVGHVHRGRAVSVDDPSVLRLIDHVASFGPYQLASV